MSKLPNRPNMTPISSQFGVDPYYGVWGRINGLQRNMVQPDGIHLKPEDFSDIYLPAILFIDQAGDPHELSINTKKQLLIDNVAVFNLEDEATRQDIGNKILLTAPNGEKYGIAVDNNGNIESIKV